MRFRSSFSLYMSRPRFADQSVVPRFHDAMSDLLQRDVSDLHVGARHAQLLLARGAERELADPPRERRRDALLPPTGLLAQVAQLRLQRLHVGSIARAQTRQLRLLRPQRRLRFLHLLQRAPRLAQLLPLRLGKRGNMLELFDAPIALHQQRVAVFRARIAARNRGMRLRGKAVATVGGARRGLREAETGAVLRRRRGGREIRVGIEENARHWLPRGLFRKLLWRLL